MTKDQLKFFNDEELNIIEARLWHALAHLDMLLAKEEWNCHRRGVSSDR